MEWEVVIILTASYPMFLLLPADVKFVYWELNDRKTLRKSVIAASKDRKCM